MSGFGGPFHALASGVSRQLHVRAAQVVPFPAHNRARPGNRPRPALAPGGELLERDFAGPAYVDADLSPTCSASPPGRPHTAATLALTEGVPVHIVAARLGDDSNTVLSTSAHLLPQSDELAAERVAALLAG